MSSSCDWEQYCLVTVWWMMKVCTWWPNKNKWPALSEGYFCYSSTSEYVSGYGGQFLIKEHLFLWLFFSFLVLRKCSLGFLVTRINLESYFSAYCQCITIHTKGTLQRFRVISNSVSYPKFQQKKNYIPFVMA